MGEKAVKSENRREVERKVTVILVSIILLIGAGLIWYVQMNPEINEGFQTQSSEKYKSSLGLDYVLMLWSEEFDTSSTSTNVSYDKFINSGILTDLTEGTKLHSMLTNDSKEAKHLIDGSNFFKSSSNKDGVYYILRKDGVLFLAIPEVGFNISNLNSSKQEEEVLKMVDSEFKGFKLHSFSFGRLNDHEGRYLFLMLK